jgi:hypothetical protein
MSLRLPSLSFALLLPLVALPVGVAPTVLAAQPLQPAPSIRAARVVPRLRLHGGTLPRPATPERAYLAQASPRLLATPAPLRRALAVSQAPNPCFRSRNERIRAPIIAFSTLALPVTGIAALVSKRKRRAAAGAAIAGALYAVGATIVLDRAVECEHMSGMIYIYTPVAAIAGAVIATR